MEEAAPIPEVTTPIPESPAPAKPEVAATTPPREGSPLGTAGAVDPVPEGEKPEGDPKPEGEKPEGEAKAALTAEDIKKTITLPEGVTADEGLMGEFSTFAAEAKLTTEQAQGLAGMYFKAQETLVSQLAAANQKAWDTTIDTWKSEIETDPVIGGDKSKAVQEVLGKVLDEYGTKEARQAFEVTAAGWNPHIIKFIHKMALALTEGAPVLAPGPAKQGPKSMASILYPDGGGTPQP